jgi:hypothetical protein
MNGQIDIYLPWDKGPPNKPLKSLLIRIKGPSLRLHHIPRTNTAQQIQRLALETFILRKDLTTFLL